CCRPSPRPWRPPAAPRHPKPSPTSVAAEARLAHHRRSDPRVDVRGKTILVTGAGRGIGRSLAVHFARKGAYLALLDTNSEDLADSCARCTEVGVAARRYVADAANEDSVVGALEQVSADFGRS